jgi:RimJ/RimL family protein N-acetyltransferase
MADSSHIRYIESQRLNLLAADHSLVVADLDGRNNLARVLKTVIPENWPPELYDNTAMKFALRTLQEVSETGWSFWYLAKKTVPVDELVGICGFKGKPDSNGEVEIGYSILRQFRSQGYATEAVSRLVVWAFSHQHVNAITAETLPHLQQSIRVLNKNGFQYSGTGSEHGVIRYRLERPGY